MSWLRLVVLSAFAATMVGCVSAPDLSGSVATLSLEGKWDNSGDPFVVSSHNMFYFDDAKCTRGKHMLINAFTEKSKSVPMPTGRRITIFVESRGGNPLLGNSKVCSGFAAFTPVPEGQYCVSIRTEANGCRVAVIDKATNRVPVDLTWRPSGGPGYGPDRRICQNLMAR
jgi:hypothetical protein